MTKTEAETGRDRALLDAAVSATVAQNQAHAARLEAVWEFHSRRVAEQEAAGPRRGHVQLTPLRETCAEVGPLLGVGDLWLQVDLDTTESLRTLFPRVWARCRSGRLDVGRARAVLDQLAHLAPVHHGVYADQVQDWFDRNDPIDVDHDTTEHGRHPLCTLTRNQIYRAAVARRRRLPRRPDTETFAAAFSKRRVTLRVDEETGMANLTACTAAHDALRADYRLTLLAQRRAQADGETRTLQQLRADTLLDLIHGTFTDGVQRDRADSEAGPGDDQGAAGEPRTGAVGGYARPVVIVTVPYSTLIGLTDDPGTLSGGHVIPADLAREISADPASTWYRMLTDDAGAFVHLSTTAYQPTDAIWRTTVTRDPVCTWPTCDHPASTCEIDHRVPHPRGATCICNTHPLCRKHHRVKHAGGYRVVRSRDGTHIWSTRHGSTFTTVPVEQPTGHWPDVAAGSVEDHPSAVEEHFRRILRAA